MPKTTSSGSGNLVAARRLYSSIDYISTKLPSNFREPTTTRTSAQSASRNLHIFIICTHPIFREVEVDASEGLDLRPLFADPFKYYLGTSELPPFLSQPPRLITTKLNLADLQDPPHQVLKLPTSLLDFVSNYMLKVN